MQHCCPIWAANLPNSLRMSGSNNKSMATGNFWVLGVVTLMVLGKEEGRRLAAKSDSGMHREDCNGVEALSLTPCTRRATIWLGRFGAIFWFRAAWRDLRPRPSVIIATGGTHYIFRQSRARGIYRRARQYGTSRWWVVHIERNHVWDFTCQRLIQTPSSMPPAASVPHAWRKRRWWDGVGMLPPPIRWGILWITLMPPLRLRLPLLGWISLHQRVEKLVLPCQETSYFFRQQRLVRMPVVALRIAKSLEMIEQAKSLTKICEQNLAARSRCPEVYGNLKPELSHLKWLGRGWIVYRHLRVSGICCPARRQLTKVLWGWSRNGGCPGCCQWRKQC